MGLLTRLKKQSKKFGQDRKADPFLLISRGKGERGLEEKHFVTKI